MYESPVSMTIRRVIEDSKNAIESVVCNAAFEMGIEIDKGELLKALTYDRDQYNNGYADGKTDATPKWISVKERLPEESDIYLVHTVHRYNRSDSYWCVCVEYFNPKDGWSSLSDLYEVTHWMPLPEPPKEAIT